MATTISGLTKKVLLVILDGFGISKDNNKNAINDAETKNLDNLFANYPSTTIAAHGLAVGLPKGVMGNSEVGHINIGAGRPVRQDLVRINEVIKNNKLHNMPMLQELIKTTMNKSKRVHLLGLLSDGGVHSHINHIKEIINTLNSETDNKIEIFYHAFMDGRDTIPDSGKKYLKELLSIPNFTFASMQGRSWGMDRDRRYEKIEKAYNMMIGTGEIKEIDPLNYIQDQYDKKLFDEFIDPILFNSNFAIGENDSVFFMNYRPDRAVELAQTLTLDDSKFNHFSRKIKPNYFLCMTPYITDEIELPILFNKEPIRGGISEYLSSQGVHQFKIAETEKFAHVTYFFNGGKKDTFLNEEFVLIPSPKEVKTYDEKPEMSAYLITDRLIKELDQNDKVDFFTVNYANADMVGHTGNYEAAIKAIQTIDVCVKKLMDKCVEKNITMILTADHGNSDQMIHTDGTPHTAHTCAPVPFVVFNPSLKNSKIDLNTKSGENEFALKDIAPTILYVMGKDLAHDFQGHPIFV